MKDSFVKINTKIDSPVKQGRTVSCGSDDSLPEQLPVEIGPDEELADEFPNEIPDTPPPSPKLKMSKKSRHAYIFGNLLYK
jgi:hypothetical protein